MHVNHRRGSRYPLPTRCPPASTGGFYSSDTLPKTVTLPKKKPRAEATGLHVHAATQANIG